MTPAAATLALDPLAGSAGREDAEPPYLGDIVTVAHRFDVFEAELLRGRLCADDIPATLADAHTVQTDTLLTAALGGVRVMVPSSYVDRARRAIAALEGGEFMLGDGEELAGEPAPEHAPEGGLPRLALGAAAGLLVLGILAAIAR